MITETREHRAEAEVEAVARLAGTPVIDRLGEQGKLIRIDARPRKFASAG